MSGILINPYVYAATEATEFIIKVKTDNTGSSNNDQFTIPTTGGGYSYDVDWGDTPTATDSGVTGNITHTYAAGAGTYEIKISGTFPRIYFNRTGDKLKLLEIMNWGTIAWTSMAQAFYECENMDITATDEADFSNVTSWFRAFQSCTSLTTIGLSANWVSSNATNCSTMLWNCNSLTTCDVSNWDTSNVTTFKQAFYNLDGLTTLDVSSWDTGNVESFNQCFISCSNITTLDVSSWDTSSGENFQQMFKDLVSLTSLDVSSWVMDNATTIKEIFRGMTSLTSLDLSSWNVSNVTSLQSFLFNNTQLTTVGNIDGWDITNVSGINSAGYLFYNCDKLTVDVSSWGPWKANAWLNSTFSGITTGVGSITGYQNWDVSGVVNFYGCFNGTSSSNVATLPSTWDMRATTTLQAAFRSWEVMTGSIDMSNIQWDSTCTTMKDAFRSNTSLTDITFGSNNDFSGVTSMQWMFYQANSLTDITWDAGLDLSALTTATSMITGGKMSTTSYDLFLIALDAGSGTPGSLGAGTSTYSAAPAPGGNAHASLNAKGWAISDGGPV